MLIKLIAKTPENEIPLFHSHHCKKQVLAEGIFNEGKRFCTVKKKFFPSADVPVYMISKYLS